MYLLILAVLLAQMAKRCNHLVSLHPVFEGVSDVESDAQLAIAGNSGNRSINRRQQQRRGSHNHCSNRFDVGRNLVNEKIHHGT